MCATKVHFTTLLKLDIAKLASYFPEFRYRAPFKNSNLAISLGMKPEVTSAYIINDNNHEKFQVLFFEDKNELGYNTLTSDYTAKELAFLFERLPNELASPLIQALKNTSLEIPVLSENEKNKIKTKVELEKNHEIKLQSLRKPLQNTQPIDFDSSQTVTVLQHEYTVADAQSSQPILGTFGASSCVILALYDKEKKSYSCSYRYNDKYFLFIKFI